MVTVTAANAAKTILAVCGSADSTHKPLLPEVMAGRLAQAVFDKTGVEVIYAWPEVAANPDEQRNVVFLARNQEDAEELADGLRTLDTEGVLLATKVTPLCEALSDCHTDAPKTTVNDKVGYFSYTAAYLFSLMETKVKEKLVSALNGALAADATIPKGTKVGHVASVVPAGVQIREGNRDFKHTGPTLGHFCSTRVTQVFATVVCPTSIDQATLDRIEPIVRAQLSTAIAGFRRPVGAPDAPPLHLLHCGKTQAERACMRCNCTHDASGCPHHQTPILSVGVHQSITPEHLTRMLVTAEAALHRTPPKKSVDFYSRAVCTRPNRRIGPTPDLRIRVVSSPFADSKSVDECLLIIQEAMRANPHYVLWGCTALPDGGEHCPICLGPRHKHDEARLNCFTHKSVASINGIISRRGTRKSLPTATASGRTPAPAAAPAPPATATARPAPGGGAPTPASPPADAEGFTTVGGNSRNARRRANLRNHAQTQPSHAPQQGGAAASSATGAPRGARGRGAQNQNQNQNQNQKGNSRQRAQSVGRSASSRGPSAHTGAGKASTNTRTGTEAGTPTSATSANTANPTTGGAANTGKATPGGSGNTSAPDHVVPVTMQAVGTLTAANFCSAEREAGAASWPKGARHPLPSLIVLGPGVGPNPAVFGTPEKNAIQELSGSTTAALPLEMRDPFSRLQLDAEGIVRRDAYLIAATVKGMAKNHGIALAATVNDVERQHFFTATLTERHGRTTSKEEEARGYTLSVVETLYHEPNEALAGVPVAVAHWLGRAIAKFLNSASWDKDGPVHAVLSSLKWGDNLFQSLSAAADALDSAKTITPKLPAKAGDATYADFIACGPSLEILLVGPTGPQDAQRPDYCGVNAEHLTRLACQPWLNGSDAYSPLDPNLRVASIKEWTTMGGHVNTHLYTRGEQDAKNQFFGISDPTAAKALLASFALRVQEAGLPPETLPQSPPRDASGGGDHSTRPAATSSSK